MGVKAVEAQTTALLVVMTKIRLAEKKSATASSSAECQFTTQIYTSLRKYSVKRTR
jgi:hypothetical protein